jgi:FkbM family methyltransferase
MVNAVPRSRYVGFEADREECDRLNRLAKPGYTYHPIALGRREEVRKLHVTRNPACASFFEPDEVFWGGFLDCAPGIEVKETREVRTVALDNFLPTVGVNRVDFLELDTQGSELEILQGAGRFLSTTVLGLRVEVEFSQMYRAQPLFSDVDAFIRMHGFMLFDLTRHRYRRQNFPQTLATRGQLLYGHGIYLKSCHRMAQGGGKEMAMSLALVAGLLGFVDYCLEVVDFVLSTHRDTLSGEESTALMKTRRGLLSGEAGARLIRLMSWLAGSRWKYLGDRVGTMARRVATAHSSVTEQRRFSWSD